MNSENRSQSSSLARIVWVIIGCLAWKFGVVAESRGLARESLVALLIEISAFGLGLGAFVVAVSERAQRWLDGWRLFAVLAYLFVTFGVADGLTRAGSPYTTTTDAHVYLDYAARQLLAGHNPYDTSLYGAIVSTRTPIAFQTPLDNGGMSDRLAYPSLSFLALVPFVLLHIPTLLAYAAAFFAILLILFKVAPRELRPLVLLPFFADETYLGFAFGGITDTVWALLLCLVVLAWRRPRLAALLFGLACASKQHAWLLAPFLAIRIATELPRAERLRGVLRFSGIAIAVFLVLDVPFFLWNPRAWAQGVVEPLVTSMVPLGEGVSSLLVYAGFSVPKPFFSVAFWGSYLVLLLVTASWRGGVILLWIAPSLAFFLNYRSLNSYWYFNALPLVTEVVWRARAGTDILDTAPAPLLRLPWRRAVPVLAAFALLLAGAGAWASHARNASVDLFVDNPVRTFLGFVYRVDLTVVNRGNTTITPRFWVQGATSQPLAWHVTGPADVAPGVTASYSIDAPNRISQFEIPRGARITLTDLSSSLRASVSIDRDPGALSPHAVPNNDFRYWDIASSAPNYWGTRRYASPGAHALPVRSGPHPGVELVLEPDAERTKAQLLDYCQAVASCFAWSGSLPPEPPNEDAREHRVEISTDFVAHPGRIAFWAHPPKGANQLPALDDRYGVQLFFENASVTLLFGGEAGEGVLEDGTPYRVLAGPREAWQQYTLDLRELTARYAPSVYPKTAALWRFPLIEIPMVVVGVRLFYASKSDVAKSAVFGGIDDGIIGADRIDREMALLDEHPGMVDAWRSRYEWELKNPTRAKDYLARARRNESHPELDLLAAEQALATEQPAEATRIFEGLLTSKPIDARIGLGHIALLQRQPAAAQLHFEKALAELGRIKVGRLLSGDESLQRLVAQLGLSDSFMLQGDCAAAQRAAADVPDAERLSHRQAVATEPAYQGARCP